MTLLPQAICKIAFGVGSRRTPRRLGTVLALALAGVLAPGPTVRLAASEPPPLRLGIQHPHPRLCLTDEPAQRDLRVLRRVFGVFQAPERRLEWPWYLAPGPTSGNGPSGRVLDTLALWDVSPVRLRGAHPVLPTDQPRDRLAAWRAWVLEQVPTARPVGPDGPLQIAAPSSGDPFFASRLAGSRVLPFAVPVGAAVTGSQTSLQPCRDWPAGVALTEAEDRQTYQLNAARDLSHTNAPGYTLTGYRVGASLWRDYFRGRLDALLLEGRDLDGVLRRYRASQLGSWGAEPGTQQVVLRFAPRLEELLGGQGRLALSLALSRDQLARTAGAAEFDAARTFFDPLRDPSATRLEALAWNSLGARRIWLGAAHQLGDLKMGVPDHPMLIRIAERAQAQWSRTLNLSLRIVPLPFDQFARALGRGTVDLALDVVDLDDGSLQDLWRQAVSGTAARSVPQGAVVAAALEKTLAGWERRMSAELPYLPLLGNRHWVLMRRGAPPELLLRACPGCRPASAPGATAPEPDTSERFDPRG